MGMPHVWLPEIAQHITSFLPQNVVACTIRLLNKATAAQFREHTRVRLSKPSPHPAFAARWTQPGALRSLTLKQRRRLVSLTAASGDTANLALAVALSGCVLRSCALEAAAAAGQLGSCQWLRARGCPWGRALAAAARAGRREVCNWFLTNGCSWTDQALFAAARGGHVELLDWLLTERPRRSTQMAVSPMGPTGTSDSAGFELDEWEVLAAAAEGCLLQDLVRLCGRLSGGSPASRQQQGQQLQAVPLPPSEGTLAAALAAAARSPTPDWTDKIAWLEARWRDASTRGPSLPAAVEAAACAAAASYVPCPSIREEPAAPPGTANAAATAAAIAAAPLPDGQNAGARLAWLRQRGYKPDASAVESAARAGNVAAVQQLLELGIPVGYGAAGAAAAAGHVDVLRLLHSQRRRVDQYRVVLDAARGGHLDVLIWAEAELGVDPRVEPRVRGYLLPAAAESGALAVVEWAAGAPTSTMAEGSPPPPPPQQQQQQQQQQQRQPLTELLFGAAASAGCEEALEWLAERGCAMGLYGDAYVLAAVGGDLATLRCLSRLGCPWGPTAISGAPGQAGSDGGGDGGAGNSGTAARGGRCVLTRCAQLGCPPAVLDCCVELGCPRPDGRTPA